LNEASKLTILNTYMYRANVRNRGKERMVSVIDLGQA